MAKLDALIGQVPDPATSRVGRGGPRPAPPENLRPGLRGTYPEITLLPDLTVKVGATVFRREDTSAKNPLTVTHVNDSKATVVTSAGEETVEPVERLHVLRRFGDPIYPALTPIGNVQRGEGRPFHAVIEGENYHALQLLQFMYESQVDCIYVDPPYNIGVHDWKYNNHFVDKNDRWRHSKWLSMMEKRLLLAKKLLKPDGVLIVTIDENEVHHLGMLLERIFKNASRQMVTICINPAGASSGDGLSRVEEYAFFCFLGGSQPVNVPDDMLVDEGSDGTETSIHGIRWERLMRGGNAWYRASRLNLCYPILLNADKTRIICAKPAYNGSEEDRPREIDGHPVAWPVRTDGKLGIWRVEAARMNWLVERGYAQVSSPPGKENPTLRYLLSGTVDAIENGTIKVLGRGKRGQVLVQAGGTGARRAKTMWYRGRHTAGGGGGTGLLNALLGERNVFPFPKSIYAVRDCLEVAIGDRPNALILDFFAGSGTTLHATCLLNATDGGTRRCVLVTNNEVEDSLTRKLNKQGFYAGDAEFDRHGIFEAACRPRCEAAITGRRPDSEPVIGQYLGGTAYADGFRENCIFLRLDYLEPDDVELGYQFQAIMPLLWLASGGLGPLPNPILADGYLLPLTSPFGVLFRESAFRRFAKALESRSDVSHLWLVTDSERAFADMRAALPSGYSVSMLYRDYLRNFAINMVRS